MGMEKTKTFSSQISLMHLREGFNLREADGEGGVLAGIWEWCEVDMMER